MKEILMRSMTEKDIASVVTIEKTSFSLPWSETSFIKELYRERSIPKVAELDGAVIGYVCFDYVLDEGHILNLAVHPDYRRRGIATVLVKNALEELKLKGCRFVYLEVRASNLTAIMIYRRLGFTVVGERKKYYVGPVEDAAIMMLEL